MALNGAVRNCLAAVALLAAGVGTHAAPTVTLAVPELTNLAETDGSGGYQRLLDQALEPLDVRVEAEVYPYRRALQVFGNAGADCLLSLTDVLEQRVGEEHFVHSYPLGTFRFHIFTPVDEPPLESVSELRGLVVGSIKGHEAYLDSVLDGKVTLEQIRSEAQAVRMLRMGRLDALIAAIPDIRPLLGRLAYAPDRPLLRSFDRINCHDTEPNRVFVRALSGELRRLKAEGVYQEVLGELYVPFRQ